MEVIPSNLCYYVDAVWGKKNKKTKLYTNDLRQIFIVRFRRKLKKTSEQNSNIKHIKNTSN